MLIVRAAFHSPQQAFDIRHCLSHNDVRSGSIKGRVIA